MENNQQNFIVNIVIFIFFILLFLLLYSLRSIFLPFILALIFAYILHPIINIMKKRGIPLSISILLIYTYVLLLIYSMIFFVLPGFLNEIQLFIQGLPDLLKSLQQQFVIFNQILERFEFIDSFNKTYTELIKDFQLKINDYLSDKIDYIFSFVNYIFAIILTPVLSYYMLRDRNMIKKKLITFLPPKRRKDIINTASKIDHLLKQFLYGYLTVSLVVGLLSFIFLAVIKIKYALVFGFIMAIGELIPYFGPVIATVITVGITLLSNPLQAVYAAIALIIVQQIDGAIITPKIIGQRTGLHPLVVIFVVLAGGYWFGMAGHASSSPCQCCFMVDHHVAL